MRKRSRIGMRSMLAWLAVIGVAALLIGVSTGLAVSSPAGTPTLAGSPTPTATAQPGSWPPPHIAQSLATAQADPRANRPPNEVPTPAPPPNVPPGSLNKPYTPISGIFETHQGPFSQIEFRISNAWQGPVGPDWLVVYAGGKRGPQPEGKIQQGVLRIDVMQTDVRGYHSYKRIGDFPAPVGPDPLTITAVDGVIMRLRTDSGKILSFNLQTHQYQESDR